jgi:hypothetical protein
VPTVLSITGSRSRDRAPGRDDPDRRPRIGTTGILGVTYDANGRPRPGAFRNGDRGLGLALARDWHFLAAWLFVINGTLYLLFGLFSGHFRRDLAPGRDQSSLYILRTSAIISAAPPAR